MSTSEFRAVVQQTVEAALDRHITSLRNQLVSDICGRLDIPASGSSPATSPALSSALRSIQEGATQADILSALLQSTETFASRAALLVLRGGGLVTWRARGFSGKEPSGLTLNSSARLVSRALSERVPVTGPPTDFDSSFLSAVGAAAGEILLIPLLVREKVAALLYADSGLPSGNHPDLAALDCLVRFAGTWVELAGLRKSGASPAAEPSEQESRRSTQDSPALSQSGSGELRPDQAFTAPVDPFSANARNSTGANAPRSQAADQNELHKKARRFAKLLVDEIQLYNQEKVDQGRRHADLYVRLKVEIEKSRAAYDKRYGQALGGPTDYFRQELVRILANNNPALLGSEDSS